MPTYHVSNTGSDAATGLAGHPWQTLNKVLGATFADGDSILFNRGDAFRFTNPASDQWLITKNLTVGAYGSGDLPVLSGGTLLTSWTRRLNAGASEILLNPGFETALTGPWTAEVGSPAIDGTVAHTGSSSLKLTVASDSHKVRQDVTLTAGTLYTISYWHKESTTGRTGALQVMKSDGSTFLQADGTWGANTTIRPANSTTWAKYSLEFTAPSSGTYYIRLQAYDGGTYNIWYDDVSLLAHTVSTNIFHAPLPTRTHLVTVDETAYTVGTDITSLTSGQYLWSGGLLYINADDADPAGRTVEAAQNDLPFRVASSGVTFENVAFSHGNEQALRITCSGPVVVQDCEFRFTGGQGINGGVLCPYDCAGGVLITRNTIEWILNDGIWAHNCANMEISHNAMSHIGYDSSDAWSDGIQLDDSYLGSGADSSGLWVHHNTIDFGATYSPKGAILVMSDPSLATFTSGIVEHNTCEGAEFGIGVYAPNLIVRYNTLAGHGVGYGGGIHSDNGADNMNNVQIVYNTILDCLHGIILQAGSNKRLNWTIAHNTIYNPTSYGAIFLCPTTGLFENNIIWWTTPPAQQCIRFTSTPGTWTCDYNLYGAAFANYLRNGANTYSTLAAWTAATGRDAHSLSSDPLFRNPGAGDFSLKRLSPAIDVGDVLGGIGQAPIGNGPDLGSYEYSFDPRLYRRDRRCPWAHCA
jgi:hypothetical protein